MPTGVLGLEQWQLLTGLCLTIGPVHTTMLGCAAVEVVVRTPAVTHVKPGVDACRIMTIVVVVVAVMMRVVVVVVMELALITPVIAYLSLVVAVVAMMATLVMVVVVLVLTTDILNTAVVVLLTTQTALCAAGRALLGILRRAALQCT